MKTEKLTEKGLSKEIELTRGDLIEKANIVEKFKSNDLLYGQFTYALARNILFWDAEVKPTVESIQPKGKYLSYQRDRFKLAKDHAKKNENGKPIAGPPSRSGIPSYDVDPEKEDEFLKKEKALKEKYKTEIAAYDAALEEYPKLLEGKVTAKVYLIPIRRFPKNVSLENMIALMPCIKEGDLGVEQYYAEQEAVEEAEKAQLAKEKKAAAKK